MLYVDSADMETEANRTEIERIMEPGRGESGPSPRRMWHSERLAWSAAACPWRAQPRASGSGPRSVAELPIESMMAATS